MFERLLNSVHEMHIVFENLSNINGDMLQKAWGLSIDKDSILAIREFQFLGKIGPLP